MQKHLKIFLVPILIILLFIILILFLKFKSNETPLTKSNKVIPTIKSKQIIVKVIDKETKKPIQNARATIANHNRKPRSVIINEGPKGDLLFEGETNSKGEVYFPYDKVKNAFEGLEKIDSGYIDEYNKSHYIPKPTENYKLLKLKLTLNISHKEYLLNSYEIEFQDSYLFEEEKHNLDFSNVGPIGDSPPVLPLLMFPFRFLSYGDCPAGCVSTFHPVLLILDIIYWLILIILIIKKVKKKYIFLFLGFGILNAIIYSYIFLLISVLFPQQRIR